MVPDGRRVPNEHLRFVREQFPSRQTPGACLSRQELAELVNAWIFDHAHERTELDDKYIGKLERGVIRWPNKLYRQALRAVLMVQTDAQLGFYMQRRRRYSTGATVDDVDRQQFSAWPVRSWHCPGWICSGRPNQRRCRPRSDAQRSSR
jgi:hypothetical protein